MTRAKTVIGSLPANVIKLVKAAGEIATTPAARPDFLHAVMCQAALPRSRQEGLSFERKVGNLATRCDAGKAWTGTAWEQQPLPFGVRPRLALIHICSEAVRKQSKEIEVGHSVRDFLLQLGMDTSGRGYSQFHGQMAALAACRLQFGMMDVGAGRVVNMDAKPISRFDAWLSDDSGQRVLWPGKLTLTGEFFDSLLRQAVPLDHRALAALSSSALSLDLYTWLAYRLCNVRRATGERVSWASLEQQFGGEYGGNRKGFKAEFKKRLVEVHTVYPDARIEVVDGGIKLLPSPPPVRRTTVAVRAIQTARNPED